MNQEETNKKIIELMNKKDFLSNQEQELFKKLVYDCDLNIQNLKGWNPLMYLIFWNDHFLFEPEEILKFLKKVNINQQDKGGYTTLMFVILFFKKIQLKSDDLYNLINKANLSLVNIRLESAVCYLIERNRIEKINFNDKQIMSILSKININELINIDEMTLYHRLLI
jgi:hypothetical protein